MKQSASMDALAIWRGSDLADARIDGSIRTACHAGAHIRRNPAGANPQFVQRRHPLVRST